MRQMRVKWERNGRRKSVEGPDDLGACKDSLTGDSRVMVAHKNGLGVGLAPPTSVPGSSLRRCPESCNMLTDQLLDDS